MTAAQSLGFATSLRRRIGAAALTVVAACVTQAPVAAQLAPEAEVGSHIATNPTPFERRQATIMQYSFAQCVHRNNPAAAARVIAHSDPLSANLDAAGVRNIAETLRMKECPGMETSAGQMTVGMNLPPPTIAAMLTEQAYLARFRHAPALPSGATEAVPRTFISTGDQLVQAQSIAAFADCVVFHDVAAADALLRTSPESAGEHAAALALAPVMGGCLQQNQRLSLNPRSMRTIVANGLWARFATSSAAAAAESH